MKLKLLSLLFIMFFIASCAEKTTYSGKIIFSDINFDNYTNKKQIINDLGYPNYVDPIEKKYFYYSEKKMSKNFFDKKIISRNLVVFEFDNLDKIISINQYNLNDENKINIVKKETSSEILEQGIIEKIFGGVDKGPTATSQ